MQDFFQLGLMPADTDYRMFSANLQGSLPGLDTALLLGAGMYHTDRDNIRNLRAGTLQVYCPTGIWKERFLIGCLSKILPR